MVVCIHMYNFVFGQAFIFACAQWSGSTVCVSVLESWPRIPSKHKFDFFKSSKQEICDKCVLNWNIWCRGGGQ